MQTPAQGSIQRQVEQTASLVAKKYDLIAVKHGIEPIATTSDQATLTISAALGLDVESIRSQKQPMYLCWIAVPIDGEDYVIKKDSQKYEDELSKHFITSTEYEGAAIALQSYLTPIDELQAVLMHTLRCNVFPGMFAIRDGDTKYRRLSWAISAPFESNASKSTSPKGSNMTIQEFVAHVNRQTGTGVTLLTQSSFDDAGHFAGHLQGNSQEELQKFLGYIASSRGRDFERVAIRYGTRNPPTFTCYVEFDRDDATVERSTSSASSSGCMLPLMVGIAVPIGVHMLSTLA